MFRPEVQEITELVNLVRRKYLTITHLTENIYKHPRINSYIVSAKGYNDEYTT